MNNIKINTLLRLFPYLENKVNASKLLIDNESIHYISIREYAEKISEIIKLHLNTLKIPINNVTIVDATAGVGGNSISFSKNFKYVYAIELNKTRSEYLQNNINIYNCLNVKVINDNCLNLLYKMDNFDIIFLDPPWQYNNVSYKKYKNLKLSLDNESIEIICNKLMDYNFMKTIPKLIVLKLPKNYDIFYFYKHISNKNIYYYDLKKMIILVIINII